MLNRIFSLFLMPFFMFGTAQAQSRASIDSPTCMMWSEKPLYAQLLDNDGYSHALFIWFWNTYGFTNVRKMPNWVNQQDRFSECFDRKSNVQCGFKSSGSIRKALDKSRTDAFNKKPLNNLFTEYPPRAAVEYAMKNLGTCFGDDPTLPTLEALDMVIGNFEMTACQALGRLLTYHVDGLPEELATHDGWGVSLNQYMKRPNQMKPDQNCTIVPKAGLHIINEYIEDQKQRQIVFDKRTIAQRIAGLDAFGITYGLIARTQANEFTPTRPLPAGASEWSNNYAEKVSQGYPEPAIPETVQIWAIEQPLDDFNAVEDPFTDNIRNHPYAVSQDMWARRIQSRLNKMAPNEERITVNEGCPILWGYAWGDIKYGKRSPQTAGEAEFYSLVSQMPDEYAQAACNQTPTGIFYAAKARYEKEQYEASLPPKPSEWDEINRRLSEYANRPSSNKAPLRPATKRCYLTGETESGLGTEVCFTN